MKLKYTMNCKKEVFFNFLYENLQKEFHGEKTIKKDIVSKMGKKVPCTLTIDYLKENVGYKLSIKSILGINTIEYIIIPCDNESICIEYIEEYFTNSFLKKQNNILLEVLFGFFLKRKKIKTFRSIENYLIGKK